jgi:hypothetical protein
VVKKKRKKQANKTGWPSAPKPQQPFATSSAPSTPVKATSMDSSIHSNQNGNGSGGMVVVQTFAEADINELLESVSGALDTSSDADDPYQFA